MNNGQLSQEYNLVQKPSGTVARGRMKFHDTFEVTGSLTNTIREEGSYLPIISKYTFENIAHVEGCSRASQFGNMPRIVQQLFKILKKIRAHYYERSSLTIYQILFRHLSPQIVQHCQNMLTLDQGSVFSLKGHGNSRAWKPPPPFLQPISHPTPESGIRKS